MPGTLMAIDRTPIGDQYVLEGAEALSSADLAKRRAQEPLKAKCRQQSPGGLFGDDANQLDLIDMVRTVSGEAKRRQKCTTTR